MTECDDEFPLLPGNGIFDFFIVIATVGKDDNFLWVMGADIISQFKFSDIFNHPFMLSGILQPIILTVFLAVEGNWRKGNNHIVDEQYDVGPLVSDDKSLAVIEPLRIIRSQA